MSENKNERRSFALPDGRWASVIENVKGKHLRQASRLTGNPQQATQFDAIAAMICVRCQIEGENILPAEIDEMDEDTINALAGEVMGSSDAAKEAKAARDKLRGKAPAVTPTDQAPAGSPNDT